MTFLLKPLIESKQSKNCKRKEKQVTMPKPFTACFSATCSVPQFDIQTWWIASNIWVTNKKSFHISITQEMGGLGCELCKHYCGQILLLRWRLSGCFHPALWNGLFLDRILVCVSVVMRTVEVNETKHQPFGSHRKKNPVNNTQTSTSSQIICTKITLRNCLWHLSSKNIFSTHHIIPPKEKSRRKRTGKGLCTGLENKTAWQL